MRAVFQRPSRTTIKRPLGKPPKWMVRKHQLEAWQTFSDEVPWLNHSHRALVGIASEIRRRLIAGEEVSVNRPIFFGSVWGKWAQRRLTRRKSHYRKIRTTRTLPINTSPDLVSRVEIRAVCPLGIRIYACERVWSPRWTTKITSISMLPPLSENGHQSGVNALAPPTARI